MWPNQFFCQNIYITGTVEKIAPPNCATSVIFKPLSKANKRPIGEKSHNLVTLTWNSFLRLFFIVANEDDVDVLGEQDLKVI
jgi:hypothetical protein